MTSYAFTDLLNRAPSEIRNNAADARSWLTDNMSQTISPSKMLEKDPSLSTIQRAGVTKKSNQLFGEVARQVTKAKTVASKKPSSNNKKPNSWFL